MKNRRIVLFLAVLVVLNGALAAARFAVRDAVPAGTLEIETAQETRSVMLSEMELTEVEGTVINGKGEEKEVCGQGILLSALLRQSAISDFAEVTAEADDAYSAAVTAEEIAEPGKVFLLAQEDGGVQLVVFGDPNSKRNVSGVVRLQVR